METPFSYELPTKYFFAFTFHLSTFSYPNIRFSSFYFWNEYPWQPVRNLWKASSKTPVSKRNRPLPASVYSYPHPRGGEVR